MKKMKFKTILAISFILMSYLCSAQGYIETKKVLFKKGDSGVDTYRIPALVQTNKGTIIAFAEARKNSRSDTGDIDLVAKRSEDGGRTWSEMITVWDDGNNVCGNPCPVVDRKTGRIVLLSTWNDGRDHEKDIHARKSIDTRRVFVIYSEDDGKTWSAPKEITSSAKLPEWTWYATGPCHALQLQKGKNQGRIVVPCNHGVYLEGNRAGGHEGPGGTESHVILSDDGGMTWRIGGSPEVGNECTIAEIKKGGLILNMRGPRAEDRVQKGAARLVSISYDGGETFGKAFSEKGLIEPVCNASIINYTRKGRLTETLLFSNPDHMTKRKNMTIKQSDDSGRTWRTALRLSDLPAAYSDLLILDNGDVAIFYETGKDNCYETMTFSIISSECFNNEK